jgi:hypothetical protein
MHFQKETVDEGWIKNPSLTLEKMGYSNLFLTRSYLIQEEGTCGILEKQKNPYLYYGFAPRRACGMKTLVMGGKCLYTDSPVIPGPHWASAMRE